MGEIIVNSVKTKRQANYNSTNVTFRDFVETPLSVGLGLYVHYQTRTKRSLTLKSPTLVLCVQKSTTN